MVAVPPTYRTSRAKMMSSEPTGGTCDMLCLYSGVGIFFRAGTRVAEGLGGVPAVGRAADPTLRRPSSAAKERGGRAKKLTQTPATGVASQSPSIKSVLVGDAPAPITIDIRTNEEGNK